jgi:hypothetical protein
MLLGRPWLKDAKVFHDWGNNIITIQGIDTIKNIPITKKLGAPTKCPHYNKRGVYCDPNIICRNPNLAKCAGEAQHLEKLEIWSPPGLSNVQSLTARGKTPHIGVFLVSLERS